MDQRTLIYALCIERKLCECWAKDPSMSLDDAMRAADLTIPEMVMCACLGPEPLRYEYLRKRNERRIRDLKPSDEIMRSFFEELLPALKLR